MKIDNKIPEKPSFTLGNTGRPENIPINNLSNVGSERVNSLKESIKEIDFLIGEREELSENLSKEVQGIKTKIENFLLTNEAVDTDGFRERNGLRQKQIDVSELELNEKVNCWRDVALLKKEKREKQKDLSEKEERAAMFKEILE